MSEGAGGTGLCIEVNQTSLKALDGNSELLQTSFWGTLKASFGWQASAFAVSVAGHGFNHECCLLVLAKKLLVDWGLAYVPYGLPGIPPEYRELFLTQLAQRLAEHLLHQTTVFVRFDLPWGTCGESVLPAPLRQTWRLKKAVLDIQPPSTVLIDLQGNEDELLSRMKPKTRYNIRLALRKGVEVVEGDERDMAGWYALYRQTANRDRIAIHSESYYRTLLDLSRQLGGRTLWVKLLLARVEGEVVAGIIIALKDNKAWYLYGASSDRRRNYMPTYALQWRAIQLLRQTDCTVYDLFGIPSNPDPRHPMVGLYRFKKGFGGTIVNRYGCYDCKQKLLLYAAYRRLEQVRNFYFKNLLKRRRHRKH